MARSADTRQEQALADVERLVRDFFDPQLRPLGLTARQIEEQDLAQLESSLDKINGAITNPESFGQLRLKFTAEAGPVIAMSGSDAHMTRGILPLLLERKAQILDRIRALRPEEQLSSLRADVADKVNDPEARDQLLNLIDERFEEERAAREDLDREQAKVESQRIDAWEREQRIQIEIRERRWAIYHSFVERESMASIVGAILLLALAVVLAVGMFTHTAPPDVIANAFLLVLGYFFGQTTTQARASRKSEDSDA